MDGVLILKDDIMMGIDDAFNEKRYVESFVLLHGWLDLLMQLIFQNYEVSKGIRGKDLGTLNLNIN